MAARVRAEHPLRNCLREGERFPKADLFCIHYTESIFWADFRRTMKDDESDYKFYSEKSFVSATPTRFESAAVGLRAEQPEDETFLFGLYASTREEELACVGWDPGTKEAFLRMQFKAMRQGYAAQYPKGEFMVILRAGCRIGRMVIDRNSEEIRLVDIALLQGERGRGVGTSLIRDLQREASSVGRPLRLQVLKRNGAVRWYQRLGFETVNEDGVYLSLEWHRGSASP